MFQEAAISMDEIKLDLRRIDEVEVFDGIEFEDCFFVECSLNQESFLEDSFFEDSLVVCDEILNSDGTQSECLIFTSACGVADDGGWQMCKIIRSGGVVTWDLERGDDRRRYEFKEEAYAQQLNILKSKVDKLRENGEVIEPVSVFFPE